MKTEELRIRVSKEFKQELKRQAKELNLGLSGYIRMILSKDLKDKQ